MTYADVTPILTGGVTTLTDTLVGVLPIILPVAIILGLFWVAYRFLRRGGR